MTDRRRAIAYNALGRALRDADHWLPFSTRRAAVDSVLAAVDAEDQAAARPHACGNCEGIDPSSCIANPNRATRQTTGQTDAEHRVAKLEAEIARLHDEHKASLRRADQVNAELMQEVQRYAGGTERPVLWSVYNQMHSRALTAEAKLVVPAVEQPDPAAVEQFIQHMATRPDPTTADDPVPLRWGLGDVMHGDDDSVIVCLSGPDREPYWLELDPERAAAFRRDLAPTEPTPCICGHQEQRHIEDVCQDCGCGDYLEPADAHAVIERWRAAALDARAKLAAVGQPAEAHDTEAHPADVTFHVEKRGDTDWLTASTHYDNRDKALDRLARRREQHPDTEFRIVRETTTWTVEDER